VSGRLFHVSDQPGIDRFDPRPSNSAGADAVVWAISERLVHNYLLPRDCPRVTFYAGDQTDGADAAAFFNTVAATFVIAIESGWLDRVRAARLYLYDLPADTFEVHDAGAGYDVSRSPVTPLRVELVDDLLAAQAARGVDLRVTPSLWPLADAVAASTLHFSNIRMRNARTRDHGRTIGITAAARLASSESKVANGADK
jgi:hypothetical protein